jgi:hypothetical protein
VSHTRRSHNASRLGTLIRRASRWQKLTAGLLGLVALHGVYVLFVPGVAINSEELACPPAVVAAVAGSGGLPTAADPGAAAAHDTACARQGRWWVAAAGGQTLIAGAWALAVLEWGRVARRARRARRRVQRRQRRARRETAASHNG